MTILQVRLEAADVPAGYLRSLDNGDIQFAYDADYLDYIGAHAISLALPLQPEPFQDSIARPFFQNLLPENDQLRAVIEREGLDQNDLIRILEHVGADVAGALSCLPIDSNPVKVPGNLGTDYLILDDEHIREIVTRLGSRRPLPDEVGDPSPVAGSQQKVALVHDGQRFAIPQPGLGVPTTHILKVPDTSLPREAFYEAAAARLARMVGLEVAQSQSFWIADYEVLLATRFDRTISDDGAVNRIHQEDFAQAMGLPPRLKYEREGREGRSYCAGSIAALIERTANPAAALDEFIRATFFNICIGNTDNHAKNHALIYDIGPVPRLAPLYDLVPVRLSERHHHKFSFLVGQASEAEEITGDNIRSMLSAFGFRPSAASRYVTNRIAPMVRTLLEPQDVKDGWAARFHRLIVDESSRLAGALQVVMENHE